MTLDTETLRLFADEALTEDEPRAKIIRDMARELLQRRGWQRCDVHGQINADHAWGCPECIRELRSEIRRASHPIGQREAKAVAWMVINERGEPQELNFRFRQGYESDYKRGWKDVPLYTAPQEQGWVSVKNGMPEAHKAVFVYDGNNILRACWVPKFSQEDNGEFQGDIEFDEDGNCYWPEGWYEWNEHEETHWRLDQEPTHWMLPAAPQQGGDDA